jgi:surface protein
MGNIFRDSNLSVENLTAIYENWSQLNVQQNVEFGAGIIKYYFSGQTGRDILTNTYNWTITDGGVIGGVTSVPFIIEVDTANTGVSNNNQFQFTGAVGDYDVVAKQNGTQVATFNDLSNQQTITLPSSGVYILEITPKATNGFNRIAFDDGGDKLKITDIKNWGTIAWSSFESAFRGCQNMLVTATDVPNLSSVTNMSFMFSSASSANPDTSNWNVSNVTTMRSMFENATSANPNTTNWNVSSVTNMYAMFDGATSANPDTTNWNVSSVTNMGQMFFGTSSANPNTTNWDVSNVNSMFAMFYSATSANPDTSNWNVSNVTNMQYMFYNASSANPDTTNWDVSSVTSMKRMFGSASSANPNTSNWDVSNVTNMSLMFFGASSANPDTSNWDVSNVNSMFAMFRDSNLSVENLTAIYENWSLLTLQQNVEFGAGTIKYNFSGQAGRDILVNTYNWIITDGGVTSVPFIIEVDTANTGVSNNNQFQFTGAQGEYDVVAKQNDIVVATFNDLSGEQTITLPSSGVYILEITPKATNGFNRIQFNNGGDKLKIIDIKNWGTIAWSSFERAFYGCSNMLTTATDGPNLSNVTDMSFMFFSASSANPDTSNWDVSSVTNMVTMFFFATSANPDTSNWDVSSVTNMSSMFYFATSANPNTSLWDVSNVTDMSFMFFSASSANPDVSNWGVSNVTNMSSMFQGATSANPNTSNWNVSNVTTMDSMFRNAPSANPDTINWDVSNVTDMSFMFFSASSANPDTSNWDVSSVTNMSSMLENSNLSVEKLTSIYENWSQLTLQQNVQFGAGTIKYNFSGQAGRDILINTYNWNITDGGQV